jgi:hypothetical protein
MSWAMSRVTCCHEQEEQIRAKEEKGRVQLLDYPFIRIKESTSFDTSGRMNNSCALERIGRLELLFGARHVSTVRVYMNRFLYQ